MRCFNSWITGQSLFEGRAAILSSCPYSLITASRYRTRRIVANVGPSSCLDFFVVSCYTTGKVDPLLWIDFEYRVTSARVNTIVLFTLGPSKTMSVVLTRR